MTSHGYGRYTNGCRCEVCRAAKASYIRSVRSLSRKERAKAEAGGTPYRPDITHGYSGYQDYACRCVTCWAAKARADRGRPS